jgi:hypothetical protein
MPLSFDTVSHGVIPIGFFNIDSDMLLINNYFVFASDLCAWVSEWTNEKDNINVEKEFYVIKNPDNIGNLMGAIAGVIFTGFIGEVYKKYPFPENKEDFHQKPEGDKTQQEILNIIKEFGTKEKINISTSAEKETISIGDYVFTKPQFHEVISYIWRGGMPKWRDDKRPEYVEEMMRAVLTSKHWLFKSD